MGQQAFWPAVPPFALAAVVCLLALPLTIWIANRFGAIAHPGERHIHGESTPRLGGMAMFLGFAVALLVFGGTVSSRWAVIGCCGAIAIAMAIDDILELPWWTKLGLEFGVGLLAAAVGIAITYIAIPGSVIQLGWLAVPLTMVWIAGMQISINFLDGADGVAAGVVAIVAVICLLAAINRITGPADVESGVVIMSGALMGCCTGFLVLNLPPARVFMGDTGSHFLGVALGTITILGVAKTAVALALAVPLIALALPIGDTVAAVIRRRRAGRSIAEPDAGHLHHRLQVWGLTPVEIVLTFYLATAILGCLGLFIFGHRRILDVAVGLLIAALGLVAWRRRRRHRTAQYQVDTDGFLVIPGHRNAPSPSSQPGEPE